MALLLWDNKDSSAVLINSFNAWNDETMKELNQTVLDMFCAEYFKFRGDEESRCYRWLKSGVYDLTDTVTDVIDVLGIDEDDRWKVDDAVTWAFVDMVLNYTNNKDE